ncbi:hypothetical protein MHYP_G00083310 [Metynnis hypsauchen]
MNGRAALREDSVGEFLREFLCCKTHVDWPQGLVIGIAEKQRDRPLRPRWTSEGHYAPTRTISACSGQQQHNQLGSYCASNLMCNW